jgi:5-formyltetrahydrofolate cyclo-ligase
MDSSKRELRKHYLQVRGEIGEDAAQKWNRKILTSLLEMPAIGRARCVMTYVSYNREVDTIELIKFCLANGKRVAVPWADSVRKLLIASELQDFERDLHAGPFKVLEPWPQALRPIEPTAIDVHIVPGVVFDEKGWRIGLGLGYYDRFLKMIAPSAAKIGLAYELQVVKSLPHEPWDVCMDYVVTESRVLGPAG